VIYTSPTAIVRSAGRARYVGLAKDKNTHKMFTKQLKIRRMKVRD
jgi:hypothetical protein